jgi:tRNA G46 methylase TrmB
LVAGCVHPEIDFVGIEHRASLVAMSRHAANQLGLENVLFLRGDATSAPWEEFDGL